jgi:hypothetical protein
LASTINASNSGFGGIVSTGDSSGQLQLQTASTTAITIDTSQNVGIGATPSAWGQKATQFNYYGSILNSNDPGMFISQNAYLDNTTTWRYITTAAASNYYQLPSSSAPHVWRYAGSGTAGASFSWSEAMRIDSSGNLLVGQTSNAQGGRLVITGSAGTTDDLVFNTNASYCEVQSFNSKPLVLNRQGNNVVIGTSSAFLNTAFNVQGSGSLGQLSLRNSGATAGKYWTFGPNASNNIILYNNSVVGVYIVDGGTSWTGTSDERLKTNLQPIENAAEKVSTLRAVTGRFIADEENKSRAFLIAQDVQKVFPEAVDASDPEKLGIAYTDVIPLLVAAIKEQQTIINDLKARIETLEAK